MDSPGYRKPAHQYGQPFGTSLDKADGEDWAGEHFPRLAEPLAPEVLEPVDQPA